MGRVIIVMLLLAGCGSSLAPAPPLSVPKPATVRMPTARAAAPPLSAAPVQPERAMVTAEGDDDVVLLPDGTLRLGEITTKVEMSEGVWLDGPALHVVELDRAQGLRAVVLATTGEGSEDPPKRYRLYLWRHGTFGPVFDREIENHGAALPLRFPGDGSARFVEVGWDVCNMRSSPIVELEEVSFRLTPPGDAMVETSRTKTNLFFDCRNLAACPFVYVVGSDGTQKVGEILRNMRGEESYGAQSLALPLAGTSPIEVVITEEKPEVTFVDALWIETGGARVLPRSCEALSPPSYCAADGEMVVLRQGESLDIAFEPVASGSAELHAMGYYMPAW